MHQRREEAEQSCSYGYRADWAVNAQVRSTSRLFPLLSAPSSPIKQCRCTQNIQNRNTLKALVIMTYDEFATKVKDILRGTPEESTLPRVGRCPPEFVWYPWHCWRLLQDLGRNVQESSITFCSSRTLSSPSCSRYSWACVRHHHPHVVDLELYGR